eukprot:Skav211482  [mRNA]  locus=scaffold2188:92791:97353:+ [translate_table: standard]
MALAAWEQLMWDADVFSGLNQLEAHQNMPRNVLIKNLPAMGKGDVRDVTLMLPEGSSTGAAMKDFLQWNQMKPMQTVPLLWDCDVPTQSKELAWILECEISPSSQCGYGGWHFALMHLKKHFGLDAQVVAIESDIAACCAFATHHQLPIYNGFQTLHESFFLDLDRSCVLHGDVTSKTWIQAISVWHPKCVCISAPCPPWSSAGSATGLASDEGLLFPESLIQMKWLQPELLVIEQVAAFQTHPHKEFIFRTTRAIGYIHVWSRVIDLSNSAPVRRPRWLAVFRRGDTVVKDGSPFVGSIHPAMTPKSFDAVLPEDMCDDQLYITPDVRAILSNPSYAPKAKKQRTSDEVLRARCYTVDDVLPVFMASYASQHLFSEDRMTNQGCFAHILQHDGIARFWSPLEVCLVHFALQAVFIPKSKPIAYRHLGNQIAIPHAMWTLCHALKTLGFLEVDTQAVFDSMFRNRLTVSNISIHRGDMGDLIMHDDLHFPFDDSHHANIAELLKSCARGTLPDNTWWDIHGLHDLVPNIPDSCPVVDHDLCWEPISPILNTQLDSDEDEISLTANFRPTMRLSLDLYTGVQTIWVACDVSPQALPTLWMGMLVVTEQDQHLIMRYKPNHVEFVCDESLVTFLSDNQVTIYQIHENCDTVRSFQELLDCQTLFDAFGPLAPTHKLRDHSLITDFPVLHQKIELTLPFIVAAFQMARVCFRYDPLHDIWLVEIFGDQTEKITLAHFFANALSDQTMKQLGRTVHIIHDVSSRVEFRRAYLATAIPPRMMALCLAVATMKSLLDQTAVPNGRHIRIKWHHSFVWEGLIDPEFQIEALTTLFMYGLAPVHRLMEQRCVVQGKQIAVGKIADIKCTTPIMTMHLVAELWGGAGPASTKAQLRQQTRNGLASVLLEQGVDIEWIQSHMERIIDTVSVNRMIPILSQPPSVRKDSQVRQMIADCNMVLPEPPKKGSNAPQTMRSKMKKRGVVTPNPLQYTLDCSVLKQQNGEPTSQINEFGANMTGAFLTDPATALPWLRTGQTVSPDELIMLVIGQLPCETTLKTEEIVIPCWDQRQHPVLMQVHMIQFGAKAVQFQSLDKKEFEQTPSKVVAFTFWKSDWAEEAWRGILSNTNQFLKDCFSSKGPKDMIVSSWGRSLRYGRVPASIHDATSVQVHAAILASNHLHVLQKSGFNKVWASPKNEQGRISEEFRMIWLDQNTDIQQLSVQVAQLAGIAGLAKGKSSLGVRVQVAHYDEAWRALKPSEPIPSKIMSHHVYKIEPLPYACSPKSLCEWGEYNSWQIRPLRAAGPRAWIVGSEALAPTKQLVFNGQLVLPTLLPPKQSATKSPILAGPRARPEPKQSNASVTTTDAWAQYIGTNGGSGITPPAAQAPARPSTGPTEQRFVEQENKLQLLEQQLQHVNQRQDEQAATLQQVKHDVAQSEQKITHNLNQSMNALKQELSVSFADALKQQTSQFEQSIAKLTKSLHKPNKRKDQEKAESDMSS